MKSVMQHSFGKIQAPRKERSLFDMSHGFKTSFNSGYLVPVMVEEVLPGDTVNCRASFFARVATLIYPIMDNLFLDTFYFFCPTRLLWDNWERFIGAQDIPDAWDTPTEYVIPQLTGEGGGVIFGVGEIYDYMGLPTGKQFPVAGTDNPSCLPLRMYNRVWNEWFRDQNLQDLAPFVMDDGPDHTDDFELLRRGKRHDYFTACLPFPQKGDDVVLPLFVGNSVPVIGNGKAMGMTSTSDNGNLFAVGYSDVTGANGHMLLSNADPSSITLPGAFSGTAPGGDQFIGLTEQAAKSGIIADLTDVAALTVNELRESIAFQQVLELDARGGSRYTEHLQVTWGVANQDFRLQRSEYLGGSTERINVNSVAQTAPSPGTPTIRDAQAGLAAFGVGATQSGFNKSFSEHGYILALVNVRADLTYQQGLRRMWSRSTRFDFAHPALMHLGEQAVLNKEIFYTDNNLAVNNAVFGYQERFSEYRYFPSQITGKFRSDASGSLDAWHLSQDFAAVPALNATFIVDDPPIDRVIAVPTEPEILMDVYFSMKSAKCMPMYGTPGLTRF